MVYEFKLRIITAAFILFAVVGIIFAAGVGAGRFSVTQEADCPFDFEEMDIAPKTPSAYHHIGHHAPKRGIVIPLPPRRPTI